MIHGPAIEAMAGKFIHHGIFAVARHVEIEHPGRDRGAVNEKQHRPRGLAGLWRAEPLAVHPQGNVALLRPVFAAPDFALRRRRDSAWRGQRTTDSSGHEAKPRALDDGSPRQWVVQMFHAPSDQAIRFLWIF